MRRIGRARREIIEDSPRWRAAGWGRSLWRECVAWMLLSAAIAITVGGVVVLLTTPVRAASAPGESPASAVDDIGAGTLLLHTQYGVMRAPTVATDVEVRISGMIARAVVTQRFTNPSADWVEGVYLFPLPDDAAVDHLRLRVGERYIEGVIKERSMAKRVYEQAKREGKRATLLEQERPNLFTNSVANIGPYESVEVQLEYQQIVFFRDEEFRLRVPLAITPRYVPGGVRLAEVGSGAQPTVATDVADAERISPPVLTEEQKTNPVSVHIELDMGAMVERIESPTHAIYTTTHGAGRFTIVLADAAVPADRDFELRWIPSLSDQPHAALFTEEVDGAFYHLLMVLPPDEGVEGAQPLAREVVFIIDVSGSMAGTSMEQARAALALAIERLRTYDRFNVIAFNNRPWTLFSAARPASPANVRQALAFVRGLDANGGTEMASALSAALGATNDDSTLRQVIFRTDGAVGNEAQLFSLIHNQLGSTRLFTVGIGGAPNTHFMRKAAQFGRGSYTYIADAADVHERMLELFRKLENPVLSDLRLDSSDITEVESWPQRLPDLYLREPLLIAVRTGEPGGSLHLSGQRDGNQWDFSQSLDAGSHGEGMGVMWARYKIEALMDSLREGAEESSVRAEVVSVALTHHLVSKYTSLVAVDVTPVRAPTTPLATQSVPVNLPEGMVHAKVFGRLPQTGTAAPLQVAFGAVLLALGLLGFAWQRARAH